MDTALNLRGVGLKGAPRRRGPAHALGCWTQGCGAAACDARLVLPAARAQGAARYPPCFLHAFEGVE